MALLSPIFASFFWGLVFFLQVKKSDKINFNIGIFMLLAFLLYCSHAVFFNHLYLVYSYFESIYIFTMLSVYPMYFIYVLNLTDNSVKLKKQLKHFIPATTFFVLSLIMTLILSQEERIIYVKEILIEKNLKGLNINTVMGLKGHIFLFSRIVFLVQILYYAFNTIRLAKKHNEKIENYFSNTEGKTLNWLMLITLVIVISAVAGITFTFIGRSYFSENEASLVIPSVIFTSMLFIIGFKGNMQINVNPYFEEDELMEEIIMIQTNQNKSLRSQLIDLFEKDRIYKNPDLRIITLSEILKTNRTYISKLINEEFNMNFNEFVNKYRVEEARRLLEDSSQDRFTMEHIAERSGFGSVNSFTRAFKKIVGETPGRYSEKT